MLEVLQDEWIVTALICDGGRGAMAGVDHCFIRQREEFPGNARHERVVVAAGQVGTTDTAVEEYVAREQDPLLPFVQSDMSGRMAGYMENLEPQFPALDDISVVEELLRRHPFYRDRHAHEHAPRILQHRGILAADRHRYLQAACQGGNFTDMVEVSVCQHDLCDAEVVVTQERGQLSGGFQRDIDEDRRRALCVGEDIAHGGDGSGFDGMKEQHVTSTVSI